MTARWPGFSPSTSSPKNGMDLYWPPDLPNWRRGSGSDLRVRMTKTRPSTGSVRTVGGKESSKRSVAVRSSAARGLQRTTARGRTLIVLSMLDHFAISCLAASRRHFDSTRGGLAAASAEASGDVLTHSKRDG